jgi:hypothetical protein
MKCPDDIQIHLLKILSLGLMLIDHRLGREQYELGKIEVYHIHNLPSLIEDFSYDRLAYYLNVESKQYLRETGSSVLDDYKHSYNALLDLYDNRPKV